MNLSTPRPSGGALLEVHPEQRLSTRLQKAGRRAVERVKKGLDGGGESEARKHIFKNPLFYAG